MKSERLVYHKSLTPVIYAALLQSIIGGGIMFSIAFFLFPPADADQYDFWYRLELGLDAVWALVKTTFLIVFAIVLSPLAYAFSSTNVNWSVVFDPIQAETPRAALWFLCTAIPTFLVCRRVYRDTPAILSEQSIRGGMLKTGTDSGNFLRWKLGTKNEHERGIEIAPGVPIDRRHEPAGFLALGEPGSGKTTLLNTIALQACERGDRVIIHDTKGDVTERWPSSNFILLSPGDARSYAWDIATSLGNSESRMRALWSVMIKLKTSVGAPIWPLGAQEIGVGVTKGLYASFKTNWGFKELRDVCEMPAADFVAFATDHHPPACAFLSLDEYGNFTKMAESFFATYTSANNQVVRPLADAWGDLGPAHRFSVRSWLAGKNVDIPTLILQRDASSPQVSEAWISTLLTDIINFCASPLLPDDPERRIWFVLDEMKQLGHIEGLSQIREVGRTKGLCVAASLHNIAQLKEVYGDNADSLENLFGLKFAFRTPVGGSANYIVSLVEDETVSRSRPSNSAGDAQEPIISTVPPVTATEVADLHADEHFVEGFAFHSGAACRLRWPVPKLPLQRKGREPKPEADGED
ncbi:MAG TPA: hypothetical protein ENH55_13870 [Aurantimonas coralicida]|uniref:Type IV secretion system coupling protein TraD DNA-binding domain-containing protein n=2 Tax=root TaxID=1 RepID=A0A9C9NGC3_9HYPH|nr:hypothetical protein [Aurantimonas coralicida]HEU00971.1 hypothetical protein [Aurantimonas coralicida]